MGSLYGCMSFLSIDASDISDRMLADFLGMESSQIVTMHIRSVDQKETKGTVLYVLPKGVLCVLNTEEKPHKKK